MAVFFEDKDYTAYLDLLAERTRFWGVDVWSYCLMPNHVHLIVVPPRPTRSRSRSARPIGAMR